MYVLLPLYLEYSHFLCLHQCTSYVCTRIFINIYLYMKIYTYVRIFECIYVYMYVHYM